MGSMTMCCEAPVEAGMLGLVGLLLDGFVGLALWLSVSEGESGFSSQALMSCEVNKDSHLSRVLLRKGMA